MAQRPTIRDVAREAGVSLGTASRALNRAGRVSEAAIAAVAQAARRLGYVPDSVAQSMRTRSTRVVALLVSDVSNPLYAQILAAIEPRLQAGGYSLLIANTGNDPKRESALIELFRSRRVDGFILCPCAGDSGARSLALTAGLPLVTIDRDIEPGGSGIQVDHRAGALQATRYLLDLGHVRIALMTPGRLVRPGRERIAGFEEAHRERGLAPVEHLLRAERSSMEFAFSEALALLALPDPPSAFMCLGTRILAGTLEALRHAGRRIPAETSVIGVGDTDLSRLHAPAVTTLRWDLGAVGTAAAELLLQRLDGGTAVEPKRIVVTTEMVLRDSCGPAAAAPKGAKRRRSTGR